MKWRDEGCAEGRGMRERIFRDRIDPLDKYDDVERYHRFRFRREGILELTNMLRADLDHKTLRSLAVPPVLQVLIALRFYAGGSFQSIVGDIFNLHKSIVSRIIRQVSLAITARMDQFIHYPTEPAEIQRIRREFLDYSGFPGVLGIIDGTHVKIIAPSVNEHEYNGRKGGHSINVQAVVTKNGSFTNVVARYPGRAHDSRIFTESQLDKDLVAGRKKGLLIGHSAYSLSSFLMKPLPRPKDGEDMPIPHKRYQKRLLKAHACVEHGFGRLKRRFPCLHQELRYKPERCCRIIAACFYLQNFAIARSYPEFGDDTEDEHDEDDLLPVIDDNINGKVKQRTIIQRFFTFTSDVAKK